MNVMPDIAAATASAVPVDTTCDNCGQPFTPRTGSGGKPQRFCSAECRQAHHSNVANVSQCGQRGEAQTTLPAVVPQPEPTSAPADTPFDWRDDPDIICRRQHAVAVYENTQGGIVIRQEADWNDDDDIFIIIARENIAAFLDKLTGVAGVPSAGN